MHPGVDGGVGGVGAVGPDHPVPMITFLAVTVLISTFGLLLYLGRDH
jgi:hypothetical protein